MSSEPEAQERTPAGTLMTMTPTWWVQSNKVAMLSLIAFVVLSLLQGLDVYYDYLKIFIIK